MGNRRIADWLCLFLLTLSGSGCATYTESITAVESHLAAQRPDTALATLEKQGYAGRNEILYLMNKGMLLRMQGEYAASNASFAKAKLLISPLSAISISEQTTSLLINDSTRSYTGAPFEQLLLYVYSALNYLALGDLKAARVEALQIDLQLKTLTPQFGEQAFPRYLSGIIFEDLGEYSDALIAYRKAYKAYQENKSGLAVPPGLQRALLRLSSRLGLSDEHRQYQQRFGSTEPTNLAGSGELIFVFHNGLAPIKRERSQIYPDPGSGRMVRISLPYYEMRPSPVQSARLQVNGVSQDTRIVADISNIAMNNLDGQMPVIISRAVARAILKDQAVRQAYDNNNGWAGLAANVFTVLTERADTRSWLTLPSNIQLGRIPLPEGNYRLQVSLFGKHQQIIATPQFDPITIEAGKKVYVSYYWVPSTLTGTRH